MDLREEATAKDANDVISLVKHSLIDTFSDEFGNIQLSRSINGSGVSSRSKVSTCLPYTSTCKKSKYLPFIARKRFADARNALMKQCLVNVKHRWWR